MADDKQRRPPPQPGGFSDLIDQLRALPDDLREAVEAALSGDGRGRSPVEGVDLLAGLMRAQGISPSDLSRAFPTRPGPAAPEVPYTPRGGPSPAAASPGPQQPPPRRPEPAATQEQPPPRGPDAPAASAAPPPPPPPPRRRPEPGVPPELPALSNRTRVYRHIADAARLMADPVPPRPAAGDPANPYLHQRRPAFSLFPDQPPIAAPQRAPAPAPPEAIAGGGGAGGKIPPMRFGPPPADDPKDPRRKLDLDDLVGAALQLAPRPVADGFATALQRTEGFRKAGQVFDGLASAAGLARGGAAAGATAAVPGVGLAILAATEGVKFAVRKLNEFTEDAELQTARNRPLARYNGAIATAYTELSMGDLRRNMATANATEASTVALARATNKMRDSWADLDIMQREWGNRWAGFKAGVSGGVGEKFAPLWDAGSTLMRKVDPGGDLLEKFGRALTTGAYWTTPIWSAPMEALKAFGFTGQFGGANPAAARFDQGWHQELANIFHGAQVHRAGLVARPRPLNVVQAQRRGGGGDRVGRANDALRHPAGQGAVRWNQRQGLPGIIL